MNIDCEDYPREIICLGHEQKAHLPRCNIIYSVLKKCDCNRLGMHCVRIFFLGPVIQSVVSLTSSLRGQIVKCFRT